MCSRGAEYSEGWKRKINCAANTNQWNNIFPMSSHKPKEQIVRIYVVSTSTGDIAKQNLQNYFSIEPWYV